MGTYDKIGMVIGIKYTYRRIKMKTLLLVAKKKASARGGSMKDLS